MKPTPEEKRKWINFLPGKITRDGFLGKDSRTIQDIIDDDARKLSALGLTRESIAERLQFFIRCGKEGMEVPVEVEGHIVHVDWQRGMLPCPFGEPGLHPKLVATIQEKETGFQMRYSQLTVHLIRRHGFFGGVGSSFRLEPKHFARFMESSK